MTFAGPPDSYWQPPEPSIADMLDEAEFEAAELMREWEELGQMEVGVGVAVNRYATDLICTLEYVVSNGVTYEIRQEFDTIAEVRAALEKSWPLPEEYPDE